MVPSARRENPHTSIGLKGFNRAMYLISLSTKEVSVKVSILIDIRRTDEGRKNDSSSRVDGKDGWHELFSDNGKVLIDDSHASVSAVDEYR